MTVDGDDEIYRDFRLSAVHQTDGWLVTIWPTRVNQPLPDGGHIPAQATDRADAFRLARDSIDRLPGMVDQAALDASDG